MSYAVRIPRAIATDESVNGWLQMIAGLVTLDALNGMIKEYGAAPNKQDCFLELKWPNDVFCHGLKLGGLLSELVLLPDGEADDPHGQAEALREEMKAVCWARGRQVEAHLTDGTMLIGEAIGLNEDASLILRTEDGTDHTVRTADVGVL